MAFECGRCYFALSHLCCIHGDGPTMKYRILIGAMIMGLSQATPWFYGNLVTYEYSYFKFQLENTDVYHQVVWVYPLNFIFTAIGILTLDTLRRYTSPFKILILGSALESGGLFLTYFTVQHSVWATMITFSLIYGYGQGLKLALGMVYAKKSFEKKVGLAMSLVVATNGLGGILFNCITTTYVNPENLKPDIVDGEMALFSQKDLILHFPYLFLILGGLSACVEILSIGLIGGFTRHQLTIEETTQLRDSNNGPDVKTQSKHKSGYDSLKSHSESVGNSCDLLNQTITQNGQIKTNNGDIFNSTIGINDSHSEDQIPPSNLESEEGSTPGQALRSVFFYILWFVLFSLILGLLTVTSCFKLFSQMWMKDDNFLALVGSMNCVGVMVCRVGFGLVMEAIGVFSTINLLLTINTVGIAFWYFVVQPSAWLFLVWTSLLIGAQSTFLSVIPVVTLKVFGAKYYVTIWGLLMSSILIGSFVLPPLMTRLVADMWCMEQIKRVYLISEKGRMHKTAISIISFRKSV